MSSNLSLRKWSDLQNLAAVALDTGKRVGSLDDFYFDPQSHLIHAFVIKTGMFSKRALLCSALNGIGVDALTFADENALIKEGDNDLLKTAPLGNTLLSYRVLSDGGDVVGTIGNIIIDTTNPTAPSLSSFELSGGIRERLSHRYQTFAANQILRYGQDVIVIPNDLAQSL